MFGSYNPSVNAYAQVQVETGVPGADPHRLIGMLYDGLIETLSVARGAIEAHEIARKGEAIGKAVRILEEGLRGSLDRERGGALAEQLNGLYQYMMARLLMANLRSDVAMIDEVIRLVCELRDAWHAMPAAARNSLQAA